MTLGERLRKLREEKQESLSQVAKVLEISKSTLAGYENDSREPNIATLHKIADFYHVPLSDLIEKDEAPTYEPKELRQLLDEADIQIEGLKLSKSDKEMIYNIIRGVYWEKIHKK